MTREEFNKLGMGDIVSIDDRSSYTVAALGNSVDRGTPFVVITRTLIISDYSQLETVRASYVGYEHIKQKIKDFANQL